MTVFKDNELLLQFIASITLADHLGDVWDDVDAVLKKLEIDYEWDDSSDLGQWLGKNGITTVSGTSLIDEDED